MTELEYEKGARGPGRLGGGGVFAWGNNTISRATGVANAGQANEVPTPAGSNAIFGNWSNSNLNGPVRVGSFAHSSTTRAQSGAGYWGIMELSGNLWERTVGINLPEGRGYTGLHGNGQLTSAGNGAVATWPGGGSNGITGAVGSGSRGGSWFDSNESNLWVADRSESSAFTNDLRTGSLGFRGVRSLPVVALN
jgi:formylglycine-generating enzyme required for sulfatase activity